MKKLFILGFSAVLLAGGVTSCKKTSKGKMSNEWVVSEMINKGTSTGTDGKTSSNEIAVTKEAVKVTEVSSNGDMTVTNGSVQDLSYVISKDGTWSSITNITLVTSQDYNGVTVTSTSVMTNSASGSWNFLGGVDEFKKNERVIFNTLVKDEKSITTTVVPNLPNDVSSSTNSYSYANGENSMIYLVVSSKGKELQLSAEGKSTSSSSSTNSSTDQWSSTSTSTMTLVQK